MYASMHVLSLSELDRCISMHLIVICTWCELFWLEIYGDKPVPDSLTAAPFSGLRHLVIASQSSIKDKALQLTFPFPIAPDALPPKKCPSRHVYLRENPHRSHKPLL